MKKVFVVLLALMMVLSMASCGNGNAVGKEKSKPVEEVYGLDLESTEQQPMSEERGERDAIYTAVKSHFGDMTIFSGSEFAKMTYNDLKELIGVDASYYYYDADSDSQTFVWETCDYENAKVAFYFRFDELCALGSVNMRSW